MSIHVRLAVTLVLSLSKHASEFSRFEYVSDSGLVLSCAQRIQPGPSRSLQESGVFSNLGRISHRGARDASMPLISPCGTESTLRLQEIGHKAYDSMLLLRRERLIGHTKLFQQLTRLFRRSDPSWNSDGVVGNETGFDTSVGHNHP